MDPKLKEDIVQMTQQQVNYLCDIWSKMFDKKTCEIYLRKLHTNALNFYKVVIKESVEINELALQVDKNTDMATQKTPLIIWQSNLDDSIEQLCQNLTANEMEINALLNKQSQLFDELPEVDTLQLQQSNMEEFSKQLEQTQLERAEQNRKLEELQKLMQQDLKLFENWSTSTEKQQLLSRSQLKMMEKLFDKTHKVQNVLANKILVMDKHNRNIRQQVQTLDDAIGEHQVFLQKASQQTQCLLKLTGTAIDSELKITETQHQKNLKWFIDEMRSEIAELWNITCTPPAERDAFAQFNSSEYSYQLLTAHQNYLTKLKAHYAKNQQLFDLFYNRTKLWQRKKILDESVKGIQHFKNRKGVLLKEERERKDIANKLPIIEQQLKKLAKAYEEREGAKLCINGVDVLELIANDGMQQRFEKDADFKINLNSTYQKKELLKGTSLKKLNS